jgi:hypothetical protein
MPYCDGAVAASRSHVEPASGGGCPDPRTRPAHSCEARRARAFLCADRVVQVQVEHRGTGGDEVLLRDAVGSSPEPGSS